jgi:hypothetical protein
MARVKLTNAKTGKTFVWDSKAASKQREAESRESMARAYEIVAGHVRAGRKGWATRAARALMNANVCSSVTSEFLIACTAEAGKRMATP